MRVVHVAKMGTLEQFLAEYDPSQANAVDGNGRSVLLAALGNTDPAARVAIANRVLDDGADAAVVSPSGANALHVLLARAKPDNPGETVLLQRLLDGGADANAVMPKFGTPLQTLMDRFELSDEQLAPFYDVVFSRPDLDLLKVGAYRLSTLDAARKARRLRAGLVERMEAYLRDHGAAPVSCRPG